MTRAEGLPTPHIQTHELPTEAPTLDPRRIEAVRSALCVGELPLVLVVGSHEPRKNHLAVLEAAERLWRKQGRFELLFIGWSDWLADGFHELVDRLVSIGRPIVVRQQCSEEELWGAYRLARFSVFPSLLEGFGLPVAESLACGTPVITSNYGSMAEVAEKGGCLLVDPRNIDELEQAMGLLLNDDDDVFAGLQDAARIAKTGEWKDDADGLWDFFTAGMGANGSEDSAVLPHQSHLA
jgi:glycosyltransferase involved in cell wall biosynthesis